jgi:hypothetical protein
MLILCGTTLTRSIRSCEYLSYIPHGVGAFGLRLRGRTHCVLPRKHKPNTHTPPTIWDKYSPDSVSCRIGFSTLYTSMWGRTCQLQDQWPWWQRTFLGRVNPKSHWVCACLRPSDPRSPQDQLLGGGVYTHNCTKSEENKCCAFISSRTMCP